MHLNITQLTRGVEGEPQWRRYPKRESMGRRSRTIYDPNGHLRVVHRRLAASMRRQAGQNRYSTANGGSVRQNAAAHRDGWYVWSVDLANAFESVDGRRLCDCFNYNPATYPEDLRLTLPTFDALLEFLQQYCLLPSGVGLPTGGPASPDLFDWYCRQQLDLPIAQLCSRWRADGCEVVYTRYVDDLTFSSQWPIGRRKRAAIRDAIQMAGFELARNKTRRATLMHGANGTPSSTTITRVGVEAGGRLFMSGKQRRRVEGVLRRALIHGDVKPEVVQGFYGYFRSIYPEGVPLTRGEQRIVDLYHRWRSQNPRQRR